MKLQRIALQNIRMFRAAVVLDDLDPGLNVFAGPNGTGKSTLVDAIRAAFLERYKSGSVDHLRPRDAAGVAPTIQLDFTVADTPYRLEKSFLVTKRCSLSYARETLDGEDAENHLASLIGYSYAGRGASRSDNWGIPGLLWVQQGTGQDVHDQVGHADAHLQSALQALVGCVASTGGDAVIDKLNAQKDALVTGARNDPRGPYATARQELAACTDRLRDLDGRIDRYRGQVDELGRLQATISDLETHRPWERLEAHRAQAQSSLDEAERLRGSIDAQEKRRDDAGTRTTLFTNRLGELREPEALLATAKSRLDDASDALAQVQARSEQVHGRYAAAESAMESATLALQKAQDASTRADLTDQQRRIEYQHAALITRHAQALEAKAQVEVRQAEAAATRLDAADLEDIRERSADLRDAVVRLEVVGTRVGYAIDAGVQLRAGQVTLAGDGELLVTEPVEIELPGLGRLEIRPGGEDLEALVSRRTRAEDAMATALTSAGVTSLQEAEAKADAYRAALHAADVARGELRAVAPEGIPALTVELDQIDTDRSAITARLAALPSPVEATLPLADAQAAHRHAQATVAQVRDDRTQHQQQLRESEFARDRAATAVIDMQARVDSPSRQEEIRDVDAKLLQAQAEARDATNQLRALEAQAAALDSDQLRLDVERLHASANAERRRFELARDRMTHLRVEIQHVGADGLEEQRDQLHVQQASLTQRVDQYKRQVEVLTHLLDILERRRSAVQQRLLAPLQTRIDHYLRLLFPDQQLVMGAGLLPGGLVTQDGRNAGDYGEQSFGTREQLGLVCRLAYADLLKESGAPTLLVLDDALVHTDKDRLDRLKRVLYDASQRHQLIMMTCHPDRWRDLGAPVRDLTEALQPAT